MYLSQYKGETNRRTVQVHLGIFLRVQDFQDWAIKVKPQLKSPHLPEFPMCTFTAA